MMCVALPAIFAGLLGVFLLWLPISLQAQLVLSLAILGLMLLFMMRPQNKTFRLMTFVFSAVLALRYAFWRTTETLPNINEPWNFIPGIILYAAEMYCLIMLAINFFIVADPLKQVGGRGARGGIGHGPELGRVVGVIAQAGLVQGHGHEPVEGQPAPGLCDGPDHPRKEVAR